MADSPEIHFRFALAKAHEDKGDYDRAWHYYDTGNRKQRQLVFHDPVAFEVRHDEIIEVFDREFLEKHAGKGYESAAPIFIVGLPRSGSTLIEQILASHSQVEGTEELPTLSRLAVSIGRYRRDQKQYPYTVRDLSGREFRAYGRQYIEEASKYRATDRAHFTDKLPNNFSHVGLIHLILPNAKIINARRHPFDSCLGAYKQLFGKGQDFTYDMIELAVYYRKYHETMQHWHRVLPGKVLDVHYEETVTDLDDSGAAHPGALRVAVRGSLRAFPRDGARGQDGELGAGAAADLHACARLLAPLREAPRRSGSEELGDILLRAARDRAERRARSAVGPDLEAMDGIAHVHGQVHRQQPLVGREVIDRNR